ncbi:MAG: hypothetical protein ABW277_24810 [Longimicrobiaceae bacterium]
MCTPADLPDQWRALAAKQRQLGAEAQAHTLEYCAAELREVLRATSGELLSLRQAAEESGYSTEHLGRLMREGKIQNCGRKARPLLRRSDLPVKPGCAKKNLAFATQSDYILDRLFRDIRTSKYGADDVQD